MDLLRLGALPCLEVVPERDATDDVEPEDAVVRYREACIVLARTCNVGRVGRADLRACGGVLDDVHSSSSASREDVVREPALKLHAPTEVTIINAQVEQSRSRGDTTKSAVA